MANSVTRVTQQGWGGRIGGSIKGAIVGVVLSIVAVPLLFWNEGRAVKRAQTLNEGAGKVVSVHVTIAKHAGKGECQFVTKSGKLGKKVSCKAPVTLVPKGAKTWKVAFGHKLARGTYTVTVAAVDAAGNVQKGKTGTVKVR